jgi:hypothetical protein
VIDAPPEAILEALVAGAKVGRGDRQLRRRPPHHVKLTVRVLGITDQEVLEYHGGRNWLVWDADDTFQQHAQHIENNLTPEADDKTRVRFDITLEPRAPLPEFLIKLAKKTVLNAATEGLRRRVLGAEHVNSANPQVP